MVTFDPERLAHVDELESLDRSAMLRSLATAGAQVRRAVTTTRESGVLDLVSRDRPRAIVVAAMGADDLIADAVTTLAARHSPIVVASAHDLPLPGWVGSLDLVLAVSLSGRAPGPVRLALEAGRRGATVVTIGAADSPLADAAARARGRHVPVPTALAHGPLASRSAAWSMLTPALLSLAGHGVVPIDIPTVEAAADRLDEVAEASRPSSESFVSPAKILALGIGTSLPLVLADGPLSGVAARRAATMLSRSARIPVMVGELPDAAAQVLACIDGPYAAATAPQGGRDIFADPFLDGPVRPEVSVLMVRDAMTPDAMTPDAGGPAQVSPEDAARINLAHGVADLVTARGTRLHELTPAPGPDLVRLAELIALIDFATTYLALGYGLDPASAPAVVDLRALR